MISNMIALVVLKLQEACWMETCVNEWVNEEGIEQGSPCHITQHMCTPGEWKTGVLRTRRNVEKARQWTASSTPCMSKKGKGRFTTHALHGRQKGNCLKIPRPRYVSGKKERTWWSITDMRAIRKKVTDAARDHPSFRKTKNRSGINCYQSPNHTIPFLKYCWSVDSRHVFIYEVFTFPSKPSPQTCTKSYCHKKIRAELRLQTSKRFFYVSQRHRSNAYTIRGRWQ